MISIVGHTLAKGEDTYSSIERKSASKKIIFYQTKQKPFFPPQSASGIPDSKIAGNDFAIHLPSISPLIMHAILFCVPLLATYIFLGQDMGLLFSICLRGAKDGSPIDSNLFPYIYDEWLCGIIPMWVWIVGFMLLLWILYWASVLTDCACSAEWLIWIKPSINLLHPSLWQPHEKDNTFYSAWD